MSSGIGIGGGWSGGAMIVKWADKLEGMTLQLRTKHSERGENISNKLPEQMQTFRCDWMCGWVRRVSCEPYLPKEFHWLLMHLILLGVYSRTHRTVKFYRRVKLPINSMLQNRTSCGLSNECCFRMFIVCTERINVRWRLPSRCRCCRFALTGNERQVILFRNKILRNTKHFDEIKCEALPGYRAPYGMNEGKQRCE